MCEIEVELSDIRVESDRVLTSGGVMTETGKILSDLKKSRKEHDRLLSYVHRYASSEGLTSKGVGLYVFPNGHLIKNKYPTKAESAEFERIAEMYKKGILF